MLESQRETASKVWAFKLIGNALGARGEQEKLLKLSFDMKEKYLNF